MAFYDANQQQQLSPLQRALLLPPDVILRHQDLLTSICKEANFSDDKAEYILDSLLKNIQESLLYNNPQTSLTSLYILDFCIRNGNIFGQFVFGRYILQKLYNICSRDLTKVQSNHQQHQQFQYQLIGTILEWHRMYSNIPGSTLNYTFSRLQKSGILALYQSYKQTQNLFNNPTTNSLQKQTLKLGANSQQKSPSPNNTDFNQFNVPNLPPSPQPPSPQNADIDEKQQMSGLEVRGRAMTTSPNMTASTSSIPDASRIRAKSAQIGSPSTAKLKEYEQENGKIDVEKLIHRDGRVKLEYTEKFINEVNELITRYIKPTREILSRQKINLADKKLQKYLQILQIIQQRLVKVISEVKNDDGTVSLAIKANDTIVSTILWFNSLVKKSKTSQQSLHGNNNKNASIVAEKGESVNKQVMENIDLVGLEQQLLLDNANLFKKKQLRDLKQQREHQMRQQQQLQQSQQQQPETEAMPTNQPVVVNHTNNNNNGNNDNMSQSMSVSQPVAVMDDKSQIIQKKSEDVNGGNIESDIMAQQIQNAVDLMESKPAEIASAQMIDSGDVNVMIEDIKPDENVKDEDVIDIVSQPVSVAPPQIEQEQEVQVVANNNGGVNVQQSGFSSFSSIALNSTSQINVNKSNVNDGNDNVVVNVESSSDVNNQDNGNGASGGGGGDDMVDLLNIDVNEVGDKIDANIQQENEQQDATVNIAESDNDD